MRRSLILFILVIVFCNFIVAQPPFQSSQSAERSIIIEVPIIDEIPLDQNFTFHAHLHNSTNGKLINQSLIDYCFIHMYSPLNGNHIVQGYLENNSNLIDWEFTVEGGNFTEANKEYPGYIYCQVMGNEGIGGFFEFVLTVTNGGKDLSPQDAYMRIFLTLFFMGIFLLYYKTNQQVDYDKWYNSILKKYEDRNKVKCMLSGMGYFLLKNTTINLYLLGFPILFLILQIIEDYNIVAILTIFQNILFLYTIGIIIVGLSFFGKLQEFIKDITDDIKEEMWGTRQS